MDVVRAADPAAAASARTKLASFANRASGAGFSVAAAGAERAASAGRAATPEAFVKFEAMVLQTFMQSMLPKEAENVYGQGVAGEMWQAMLAEQLGTAMASRDGIGIADRVLRDHYVVDDKIVPLQGVNASPERPELETQQRLSQALVQELQRTTTQALFEGRTDATLGDRR